MYPRRAWTPCAVWRFVLCLLLLLIAVGCGQDNQAAGTGTTQASGVTAAPAETQPAAATHASPAESAVSVAPAATEAATATSDATPAESPAATSEAATQTQEATTGTAASTTTAAVVGEGSFQNPVLKYDFPDPGILKVDGTYYAYATNTSGRNVQLARSTDLVRWDLLTDAMPALPTWAKGGLTWAPEVIQVGERFALYFTARDKQSNKQCVGVATSDKPEGKFRDRGDRPLVCQDKEGGTIDANPFRDGDKLYLYFKNDGNCCGFATWLYVQELAQDGLSVVGEPTRLVRNDKSWEGRVVEAPTMWNQDGKYYLFFSANDFAGLNYAVGYATCQSPMGPCEDAPENPILKTSLQRPPVIGPGHQTVVLDDDGETWMVYHAWEVAPTGLKTNRRFMWIDRLTWEDGKPVVKGPTTAPQPLP